MGSRLTSHQLVTSYVVTGFLQRVVLSRRNQWITWTTEYKCQRIQAIFINKFLRCTASTWMLLVVDPPSTCNPIYFRQEAKHRSRIISGRPKYLLLRCGQCSRMFGLTEEHGHRLLLICSMYLDLNL